MFHPKVWVLRFVSHDGQERRYRLLCASRNLTFDHSWDTVLQLDQVDADHDGVVLDGLVNFVTALPGLAVQPIGPEQSDNIAEIAMDLRQISFAPPVGVTRMEFHPIGIAGTRPSFSFPTQSSRLLVFSPFLDATFLARLPSTTTGSAIVSRPESMDEVGAAALMRFDERFVLSSDSISL